MSEQFATEGSIGAGIVKLNGLVPKKRIVGEEHAVSASSHSSTLFNLASSSNDLQLLESVSNSDFSSTLSLVFGSRFCCKALEFLIDNTQLVLPYNIS